MALLSCGLAKGRKLNVVRLFLLVSILKKSLISQAQYSSTHIMVSTRMVASALVGSSECWLMAKS